MSERDREVIAAMARGRGPAEIPDDCEYATELRALAAQLGDVQRLALSLGRGELSLPAEIASRGPVVGALKTLNANLRHLTWQAQRVAEGDLSHRVDFLGEFSEAFNEMVRQLAERKKLEIQLRQSQKLEAVGQLAAGIAHEINTPAQFVSDHLHFLAEAFESTRGLLESYRAAVAELAGEARRGALVERLREEEEEADLEYLEAQVPKSCVSALEGIGRVAEIVAAMKEFARPDQREKSSADLNSAIQAALTVARNSYQGVAEVKAELGALPPVMCHVGELNQVLLILVANAASAIQDVAGGGRKGLIGVRTWAESSLVHIEVSDTGCGIPEEIRERIFEPFFTTREVGRGRGQGLAVARSVVVEKHGGTLTFESRVGAGTTFTVTLPVG